MKNSLKILGFAAAAEVLSLFISLTLGFSGSTPMRLISSVCTLGILLGMMAQAGFSCAKSDRSQLPAIPGVVGTLPYLCGWAALLLAKNGVLPDDFYRIYKLLFAPFLPVCNLFSDGVTASGLPWSGMWVLLVLSVMPGVAAAAAFRAEVKKQG